MFKLGNCHAIRIQPSKVSLATKGPLQLGWHCHVSVRARNRACARGAARTRVHGGMSNGLCGLNEPSNGRVHMAALQSSLTTHMHNHMHNLVAS